MSDHSMPIPYEGNEKYIFISYSHRDTERVLPIIDRLILEGYRVWYDDGISPGTEWPEVIAQHLDGCELFISFISNSYMDSFNCKREIDFAVRKRKRFLVVYLEETQLPLGVELQISTVQSVNYHVTSKEIFLEKLLGCAAVKNSGCRIETEEGAETRDSESGAGAEKDVTSDEMKSSDKKEGDFEKERKSEQEVKSEKENKSEIGKEPKEENESQKEKGPKEGNESKIGKGSEAGNESPKGKESESENESQKEKGPKEGNESKIEKASGKKGVLLGGKIKLRLLIPILAGVLVILGVTGTVIGINVSKASKKTPARTNTTAIDLTDTEITDRLLKKEAEGKNLRKIKLKDCQISVKNKEIWSEILNENVTEIVITGCGMTDADANAILAGAPGLKNLDMKDNQLQNLSFSNNPKLEKADLCGNEISGIETANLEKLTSILLDDNRLKDLDFLGTAIHLQTVSARNNELVSVSALKNCALLSKVYLSGNSISDVSSLATAAEHISELDIRNNKITGIDSIYPLPEIRNLNADNNEIKSIYLLGSAKLRYLSVRNNKIDSLNLEMSELNYLDVADNSLSGDYYFLDASKLSYGFFENNMITEIFLPEDVNHSASFSLYNNPLSKLDAGGESTPFNLYVSYNGDMASTLDNKIARRLFLVDCPYDTRVHYEEIWGKYNVVFPEDANDMKEKVDELRKDF